MSDLNSAFEAAVRESKTLPEKPDNELLLQLYALYKQATQGNNTTERPGGFDFVGQAKWDAWTAQQGLSQDHAKRSYAELVAALKRS
ncbi:acyl-CoA-binding protein [Corticibacter populi]|uniref:Acyl-CoA-binding protein n=1 Tax=Corticibacter populi TaxID=1550736 RepID=A0A3M6QPW0_9BURK|nr:acyl-CoA-binding protein [Corticibacter populi]RMX04831.1 acyl-CoA-binding protein [Corticibacter populi]RZS33750.1 acyl-CoA-binding protein [Corticibacter populi]